MCRVFVGRWGCASVCSVGNPPQIGNGGDWGQRQGPRKAGRHCRGSLRQVAADQWSGCRTWSCTESTVNTLLSHILCLLSQPLHAPCLYRTVWNPYRTPRSIRKLDRSAVIRTESDGSSVPMSLGLPVPRPDLRPCGATVDSVLQRFAPEV